MDKRIFLYGVITSVVASIAFSWVLEPSVKWIWNYGALSAESWVIEIQNKAFENASLGKRDWVTVAIFLEIVVFFWTFLASTFIGFLLAKSTKSNKKISQAVVHLTRKRTVLLIPIFVIISMFFYRSALNSFYFYVDLQMNASFSQRLDALGPHMDLAEEKRIKSAWALMKVREDYEKINRRLDFLAVQGQIVLPPLLYK